MIMQKLISVFRGNKNVRFLLFPFAETARRMMVFKYTHSKDSDYIRSLKDSHKGEQCFVIGNGPSLSPKDLDKLSQAEIPCIASNRVYYIFPQTKWRPSYYLCLDSEVVLAEFDKIIDEGDYPKIINYYFKSYKKNLKENVHFLCTYSKFAADPFKMTFNSLSDDLSKYGTKTGTVTVNGIELAIYLGFTTIYLLGVDNKYALQRQADGTITVDPTAKSYFQGMEGNAALGESIQTVDASNVSYEVAKKYADARGVKIYNATRGGNLEVFTRVDFDSLFQDK